MEKREASYTVGGNVNWYSHYREQYGGFLNINRATIWSSSPASGHISKEKHNSKIYLHLYVYCSIIYNSQDMETTKISTDVGMDKGVVLIYSGVLFNHKKNGIMPFEVTWMDLEWSQRKTNIWYSLYVESQKMVQMNLFTKQRQSHRCRKQTYGYQGREE